MGCFSSKPSKPSEPVNDALVSTAPAIGTDCSNAVYNVTGGSLPISPLPSPSARPGHVTTGAAYEWLTELGLAQYVDAFDAAGFSGENMGECEWNCLCASTASLCKCVVQRS